MFNFKYKSRINPCKVNDKTRTQKVFIKILNYFCKQRFTKIIKYFSDSTFCYSLNCHSFLHEFSSLIYLHLKLNNMEKKEIMKIDELTDIVKTILRENKLSEEFIKLNIEDKFFEDSCKYMNMYHEISELCDSIKTILKYI